MWLAFTVLLVVALARGQGTYWLARVSVGQTTRRLAPREETGRMAAVRRWLDGDSVTRGRGVVTRWGPVAIPFCYLTVGFQTVVLASAGALQMPWGRFTLAQVPGALAWALIYTTIGWAAWEAALAAAAGRPLALAAVFAVLLVVLATRLGRRPRR